MNENETTIGNTAQMQSEPQRAPLQAQAGQQSGSTPPPIQPKQSEPSKPLNKNRTLYSLLAVILIVVIIVASISLNNNTKSKNITTNQTTTNTLVQTTVPQNSYQFITITSHSPLTMATYIGERVDENFILANYNKIPLNCTVITFQPPLWYVNGRANIYATWVNIPEYARTLSNMTKCMYFDYDLTCYVGSANGTGYTNTDTECNNILRNYTVESIASQNYTGYSWNVTFHLYKVLGRNMTR